MSKTTLKEIVEQRYNTYKEYIKAYKTIDRKSIIDKIMPFVEAKTHKDKDFKELALEYVRMENLYPQEISRKEVKFFEAVNIYLLINEENELSTEILTEYNTLNERYPKDSVAVDKGTLIQTNANLYKNLPDNLFEELMRDMDSKLK